MALADFPYSFAPQPIIDPITDTLKKGATGGLVVDPATGAALQMADLNGNPVSSVDGNSLGTSQWFRSTQLCVLVKFGNAVVQCVATELFVLAQNSAGNASAATQAALDAAGARSSAADSATAAQTSAAAAQQAAASTGSGTGSLADGAVTATKIGAGAVTADKIDTGAVTSAKLGSKAVVAAAMGDAAVTTDKLGAGAVTADKLGSGAVTKDKLATGAVTADKLAAGTVGFQIRAVRTAAQGLPKTAAEADSLGIAIGDFVTVALT